MKIKESVYTKSSSIAFFKVISVPLLRKAFKKCIPSIFYHFFFCMHRAAFLPGRIPVSQVDHPLDDKIPFFPSWITIYLDFVKFWIRMLSYMLRKFGRKSYVQVGKFIDSMGDLYAFAAEVYSRNLSTTRRPFYIKTPRFFLIHLVDPHLMCIPSLHVMVVVHSYTMFAKMAIMMGEVDNLMEQIIEMKHGALAISQAILFVKQHSVNCIPAALYAMTCFTPDIFPPEEAENFVENLFIDPPSPLGISKNKHVHPSASPAIKLSDEDQFLIKEHILSLYYRFLQERKTAKTWKEPLLNFLKSMPPAGK